jgi:hypothetical protein
LQQFSNLAAPMFKDKTLQQLAEKHEYLCAGCCFNRAIARDVVLTFSDLLPCRFNLFGKPSWFDLFYEAARPVTGPELEEWRDVQTQIAVTSQ